MKLALYIDFRNGRLVSGLARGDLAALPPLIYQQQPGFELHLVEPRATGFMTSGACQTVDVSGIDVDMSLGYRGQAALAGQNTWTRDEVNDLFTGSLDLNTTNLDDELDTANELTDLLLQIIVTEGSESYPVQIPVTVRRPVNPSGSPSPSTYDPPSVLVDNMELVLVGSAHIDVTRSGDELSLSIKSAGRRSIFTVASQAAMLALSTAVKGDAAKRTDVSKVFELTTNSYGTLGDWVEMPQGADAVTSVNGRTGAVVVTDHHTAAHQSAMLALSAKVGDICTRTDTQARYLLDALPASTLTNWNQISTHSGVTEIETLTVSDPTDSTHPFSETLVVGRKYRVAYVKGGIKLAAAQGYQMGNYILDGGGDVELGNITQYTTEAECALGNHCEYVDFTATGTTLTLELQDSNFADNTAGSPAPTFILYRYGVIEDECCVGCPENSYEAFTQTATGTKILTPLSKVHSAVFTGGAGSGTHTVTIVAPTTIAEAGDRIQLRGILPASTNPTVTIKNATSGGTTLLSVVSVATASEVVADLLYTGSAWTLERWKWVTSTGEPILNSVTRRSLGNISGAVEIDLNDAAVLEGTMTGDCTFSTKVSSRASTGQTKMVALRLYASGGARVVAVASGINVIGTAVGSVASGKRAILSLHSNGAAESDTDALFAEQA